MSTLVGDVGPVHGVAAEQRGGVEQRAHPVERTSVRNATAAASNRPARIPASGVSSAARARAAPAGSGCSAVASPLRRVFQLHGCGLVGSDHGRGQVPGAAITLLVGVEDVGECAVYRAPSAAGRGAVDRRAHERMAELQPVSGDGHQSGALGLVERLRRAAQGRGGGQDGGDVTGVLGGGDVQQGLGVGWQQPDTAQVGLLDSPGQRQRVGQRPPAGKLGRVQRPGQTGQRQRVARGQPHQFVAYGGRQPGRCTGREQLGRRIVGQAGEPELGQPGGVERGRFAVRAANSSTTPSASRRRAQKSRASVDGRSSHCASSTRQSSGRSSAASASSDSTASATRNRSGCPSCRPRRRAARRTAAPVSAWRGRARDAGAGAAPRTEFRLRLDAGSPQHRHAFGRGRVVEECGLADTGLAAHDEESQLPVRAA